MNAILYLIGKQIKNSLREILRKPGVLALYILVIVGITAAIVGSHFQRQAIETLVPLFWFGGIFFAFLLIFTIVALQKGLTAGDTIFDMSDVNILFPAPISPRTNLLFGLVRLTKVSFLAGFFILFQSSSLTHFGIGYDGLLLLFALFILNTIALSIASLVIYSTTNGHIGKKRWVRILGVSVFIPFVAECIVRLLSTQDLLLTAETLLQSPLLRGIPFAGWTMASATAFLSGSVLTGFLWLMPVILSAGLMILYILNSRVDYYEDVLLATQTAFERKRAVTEGDTQAIHNVSANKKVKLKKTGISGQGASTFYFKHLRETFRQKKFGFFSLYTLIVTLVLNIAAVFLRGILDITVILQILMWLQIIMIGMGSGLKETYIHYVYLVPETSFKKILWINLETLTQALQESILFITLPGIFLGAHPLTIIGATIVFALFSFLLLGINYSFMHVTGGNISQGILLMIYYIAVIFALLPGLVPSIIVGVLIGGDIGIFIGLLILAVWESIVGLLCFFLARNILHNTDIPQIRKIQ